VFVARQVLDEAERELDAGLASDASDPTAAARFNPVALYWLRGLIRFSRGDDSAAFDDFTRELASEHAGQLYARECAANTWYAIGALQLRRGRKEEACAAFTRATARIAAHPMAHVALAAAGVTDQAAPADAASFAGGRSIPLVEAAMAQAAQRVLAGDHEGASRVVADALGTAPPGNAGWTVPIEPLLQVAGNPAAWTLALARLRNRAA